MTLQWLNTTARQQFTSNTCPQGEVPAVAISDGRLPSPICVPAGQIPPGYVDASGGNAFGGVGTRGWKTDPTDPTYGHGSPCDARLTKVTRADLQTGNAIQVYGPPGCDPSLTMTGQ